MEWIIKNPISYWWYLIPFLSEAVEASGCYFFEHWWMKLKCPNLLKPLGTIIQQNYWSFYPLEPFSFVQFNMIHPVYLLLHIFVQSMKKLWCSICDKYSYVSNPIMLQKIWMNGANCLLSWSSPSLHNRIRLLERFKN